MVDCVLTLENPIFGVGAWCNDISCRLNTKRKIQIKKKKHFIVEKINCLMS